MSAAAKLGVSEYRINRGLWAGSNSDAQLRAAASIVGANVLSVGVGGNGIVTCTYNTLDGVLSGSTLVWTPTDQGGSISWACTVTCNLTAAQDPCP
ncbi:MAG: pilin [Proteobacteria bacterium]|nr:pilin [Pseudomonadota bacterium]